MGSRQPFRYQHVTDGPTVLINYKGNGEDRNAFDDERSVSGIDGTRQQVEDFLEREELPRRTATGAKVADMIADKKTTTEIMKALNISKSVVSYHRRRNKKVSQFREIV